VYKITIAILKTGVYQGVLGMVLLVHFGNQNKGVRMILEYFSFGKRTLRKKNP
jgi:hypothetical protein